MWHRAQGYGIRVSSIFQGTRVVIGEHRVGGEEILSCNLPARTDLRSLAAR